MSEKLRVGIVGASGWMAGALAVGVEYDEKGFDPQTRSGERSAHFCVGGLCDLDREACVKRRGDLNLAEAEIFDSYESMLSSSAIDAVIVAVPNNLHSPMAVQALEAGKHLFLEKPFATTWEQSQLLAAASNRSPATTKLDYIMLHYDEQENLKSLIEQGAFGEIASSHFTYRHPIEVGKSAGQAWKLSRARSGGAIPMGICHAVSATIHQVGRAPESVVCFASAARIRAFDYPPQMDLLIRFEGGAVGLVQGNIDFAEKYDARHTVIGTDGQFDYNPMNPLESRVWWSSKSLNRPFSPDANFARHHLDSGDVWKHQCGRTVRDWLEHVRKGEKDPLLGLESDVVRRTEAVIWAAEESARRQGAPVPAGDFLL